MTGALLDVLTHKAVTRRPIWLMRQAGRYLPEYRAVRARAGSFLDLCYAPELAAEVTLQPLKRFDLDAAILFSDILVVPHAMGLDLKFVENEGPMLQTVGDLEAVRTLKVAGPFWAFDRVAETVAAVSDALPKEQTLIGFCGAPWTVATYMIEGRSSDRQRSIAIAREGAAWLDLLIERLIDVSVGYLKQQIAAGAEVVQIFDSWAGDLPADLRAKYVHAPIAKMVAALAESCPRCPVIVFARGVGVAGHLEVARVVDCAALSIEQDVDLNALLEALPPHMAVQGNLNPQLLLAGDDVFVPAVEKIVRSVPLDRHIFNLGHGIVPSVAPERVGQLIEIVRQNDRSLA
jgi:uroporphyrinogen decarboxylase